MNIQVYFFKQKCSYFSGPQEELRATFTKSW